MVGMHTHAGVVVDRPGGPSLLRVRPAVLGWIRVLDAVAGN